MPADAPAGSALGAGSHDSALGKVAELVDTVRGPYASGNPGKYAFQYPRPWRMNENSEVVDTGKVDALGFPVYDSDVIVAPQLLWQRGTTAADDGGFPSGHTNAFHLAGLAYAYAVPERFQELVARAYELSHTRIMAGMHSTVDVIGSRVSGHRPGRRHAGRTRANTSPQGRGARPGRRVLPAADRFDGGHPVRLRPLGGRRHRPARPGPGRQRPRALTPRLTYVLTRHGRSESMTVPKGAEVLLETRLRLLDAQRREVLRTTALPSGYVLLDELAVGPTQPVRRRGRVRGLRLRRERHHERRRRGLQRGRHLAQRHLRVRPAGQARHRCADPDGPQRRHRASACWRRAC